MPHIWGYTQEASKGKVYQIVWFGGEGNVRDPGIKHMRDQKKQMLPLWLLDQYPAKHNTGCYYQEELNKGDITKSTTKWQDFVRKKRLSIYSGNRGARGITVMMRIQEQILGFNMKIRKTNNGEFKPLLRLGDLVHSITTDSRLRP